MHCGRSRRSGAMALLVMALLAAGGGAQSKTKKKKSRNKVAARHQPTSLNAREQRGCDRVQALIGTVSCERFLDEVCAPPSCPPPPRPAARCARLTAAPRIFGMPPVLGEAAAAERRGCALGVEVRQQEVEADADDVADESERRARVCGLRALSPSPRASC